MPNNRNYDFVHKKEEMTVTIYADSNTDAQLIFRENIKDPDQFRLARVPLTFEVGKEYILVQTGVRIKIISRDKMGYLTFRVIKGNYNSGLNEFHPTSDFAKWLVEAK